MTLASRLALAALLSTGALLLGCSGDSSGDHSHGEDAHSHSAAPRAAESAHGSRAATTEWSDRLEIFAEHPVMVAGQESAPWAVHVTRLDGYRPLTEGALTLRFRRPDGAAYVHTVEGPPEPGIFTPQPSIPETGTFRLFLIVDGAQVQDTIEVGDVTVHESAAAAPASGSGSAEISYLKEQQWETAFGIAEVQERSVQRSVEAAGTIEPVAGQFAKVSAPVSGLTPARANLNTPAPGDRVREGQTLATLSPSGGEGSYADLMGRVQRLQREVRRAERLVQAEAIPQKRLVEARHDLTLARAALESMGGSDGQRASTSSGPSTTGAGFNYDLKAPISGRVQERHLAPGSRVEVGTVLYTIVDPSRVWLRLRVPAEHASAMSRATGAVFTVEGSDTIHQASRVVSTGAAIDTDTRTLPVRLEASNSNGALKIGMMADAQLLLADTQSGVAIPNEAIQTEDGQPVAYVETGGESFERRPLELGPTDGQYTLIERGVQAGEHVVTTGAYQVYLASLNTSQIGHGHTH
ncbi:efflux RND transporter periplasmic adaptor subunit [Salinibacter ruber]|uniref:RND family efflux transporter MFP subunit n=1 Tax=Salinibacter ruber TaxID=146919 RepID=A0A9X2ZZZ9_9BACT|nr:efflux RND transporter periplasmic adaptor subunit [Salinibacter ruber]MCS3613273.1 RND family efflux transporter MFP subunit [Salinibacter ruber]MCS3616660.1 RND family efflux transporter MFP subunit [Salinibacter ruber]MCS3675680.1 RND family efflux transporter MFP subunit [Salinibacter ruber]MCS3785526.1 RND family efflux transporter MFP subunit [Salinibacter ruber]MCS4038007.1 RND family efflux transporter MFP subunit [Salinibacter ruber]